MPYNDVFTIEEDSVIVGGTKQSTSTNKLFECNIPAKFTNYVIAPHANLNYEFHPITLASTATASSIWNAAGEPSGGLFYILENKKHVIICGDIAFTPSTGSTVILSEAIPEELRPSRIIFNQCPGNCDTGTGLTNNRILKMMMRPDGKVSAGASTIPGGAVSATPITKCSVYIEYWLD